MYQSTNISGFPGQQLLGGTRRRTEGQVKPHTEDCTDHAKEWDSFPLGADSEAVSETVVVSEDFQTG